MIHLIAQRFLLTLKSGPGLLLLRSVVLALLGDRFLLLRVIIRFESVPGGHERWPPRVGDLRLRLVLVSLLGQHLMILLLRSSCVALLLVLRGVFA